MRLLEHPLVTAFGATSLCLLIILAPVASGTHVGLFHVSGSAAVLLGAVLLNVLGLWLVLGGTLWLGDRWPWLRTLWWTVMGLVLPWVLLRDWYALRYELSTPEPARLTLAWVELAAAAVLIVLWRRGSAIPGEMQRFGAVLLGFAAISGAWMTGEVIVFGWEARHLNAPEALVQARPADPQTGSATGGRVIWIVLDELSYRQVYEHRAAGLSLPAFDALAAESVVFTNVQPTAMFTEVAIPSLLTGKTLSGIDTPARGWPLLLRDPASGKWGAMQQRDTVFGDAQRMGDRTGVAGWYVPYCRLLPEVLDRCTWSSRFWELGGGMFAGESMWWNAEQPILRQLGYVFHLAHGRTWDTEPVETPYHIEDYKLLLGATDSLLQDRSIQFVYLHMPVPHPGGIYNRHTHSFELTGYHSSYLDNLALADEYLAHVRAELEAAGEWDSATVLVMGDHSWRYHIRWNKLPDWTAAEQAASDNGRFDPRPAYLVKLPGETSPAQVTAPFPAVRTRAMVDLLMQHRITTPAQLSEWAQH